MKKVDAEKSSVKKNVRNPIIAEKYDFKLIEAEVSELWKRIDVEKETISFDSKKKLFSFLEGPPTANAPPALHHIEVRVFKDVMCRFKYMQGFTVPRKGGWDCHGLPVEVQVEKKLSLKSKKDVISYGVAKFNAECRADIFKFIKDWEVSTKRLAYWTDLEQPYRTLDNNYIESVWWSLKELYNKNLLYEGHKVVPYCPRCETPLSSHEVALGYEDVAEDTIAVKFKSVKNKNRFFVAWTTTPWTLPGNLCLAVNPAITYAIVNFRGEEFVLAKALVNKYFDRAEADIIKELSGKELIGEEYEPLFDFFKGKLKEKNWFIVGEEYVSIEDGTGIVHQAPAFGEIDYESCKRHALSFIQPVDSSGKFTDDIPLWKGMFVKDADKNIIAYLDGENKLVKKEKYTHSYPFCWRCHTPLLYYAMVSWFIGVSKFREKLLENNKQIQWFPAHIKEGRFGKWLEGAKDWALSRTKFWGSPLPIWRCSSCKNTVVIGSIQELREKSGQSLPSIDLHKPVVDGISWECKKCNKGAMSRLPDVIDCWYDSGSAPFAQFHYPFENQELFKKSFPYDFIAEAIDQTRGWFYTLHVLSALLFDSIAFKRCAVGGLLCDEKGEKMSKSKGNIVNPNEFFDKFGVDTTRILMCKYPLGENICFGEAPANTVVKPFLTLLWNVGRFVQDYTSRFPAPTVAPSKLEIEDEWILSALNTLTFTVIKSLDNGEYDSAISAIMQFTSEDFSRWYIKLVRDRAQDKDVALSWTLSHVTKILIKLLASFMPYTCESLYQSFDGRKESVHLESFPAVEKRDTALESSMKLVKNIVQAGLSAREKANLSVRWPVKEIIIVSSYANVASTLELFIELIKNLLNTKSVIVKSAMLNVEEKARFDFASVRETFGKNTVFVVKALQKLNADEVYAQILKKQTFAINLAINMSDNANPDDANEAKKINEKMPEKINENENMPEKITEKVNEKINKEKNKIAGIKIAGITDATKINKSIGMSEANEIFNIELKHLIIEKKFPSGIAGASFDGGMVYVDTVRTSELEAEGFVREIMRKIQELRKTAGLNKDNKIMLHINAGVNMQKIFELWKSQIIEKANVKRFTFGSDNHPADFASDAEISEDIKGEKFTLSIVKV